MALLSPHIIHQSNTVIILYSSGEAEQYVAHGFTAYGKKFYVIVSIHFSLYRFISYILKY
jgi:hypothetical protein